MTMFRVRAVDGATRSVTSGRVVVDGTELRSRSPGTSGWVTVDSMPLSAVARVERRCNEPGGRVCWVDEVEANDAAAAARPATAVADQETAPGPTTQPRSASTSQVSSAAASAPPPPAVSARDVRCPSCGQQEELSGRREQDEILLTCHTCGYDGPRVAERRCETCGGGDDVVERPKALVERSRGTRLNVVGSTTAVLCRVCDAGDLAAASHGGALLREELPTVDPQTLREMSSRPHRGTPAP